MKTCRSVILSLLLILCLSVGFAGPACSAAAEEKRTWVSKEELAEHALKDFHGWNIWLNTSYGSGTWNGELAIHAEIMLYRIQSSQIEFKKLYVLVNPLKPGEEIPWQVSDWAPVPIKPGMEETLSHFTTEELYNYGSGVNFSSQALPLLAPELTEEDESLYQLKLYADTLIANIKSSSGLWRLKIAEWDGTGYSRITATPPQPDQFVFNRVHSVNSDIEFSYSDHMEGLMSRSDEGAWHLTVINNGGEILSLHQDNVEDITLGYDGQSNDVFHYGSLPFSTDLNQLNLSQIPIYLSEILPLLDPSLCVCTAKDNTPIYSEPGGPLLSVCYARVPGTLISQEENWVHFRIGSEQEGLTVWSRTEDMAFGTETENVICSFPSYETFGADEPEIHSAVTFDGRIIRMDSYDHMPWLIGKTENGDWLVLLNGSEEGTVCTAAEETFQNIGPTWHQWDDEEEEDWDDEDWENEGVG